VRVAGRLAETRDVEPPHRHRSPFSWPRARYQLATIGIETWTTAACDD
jgi:hypothetical protein